MLIERPNKKFLSSPLQVMTCKAGTTLVEILTVLVALGVIIGIVGAVFLVNWAAYARNITRAHMQHELNEVIETMTRDGRKANRIDVTQDADVKSAAFIDRSNQEFARYQFLSDGSVLVQRANTSQTFTQRALFDQSLFDMNNRSMRIRIALQDRVFINTIVVDAETEIYPRNQ